MKLLSILSGASLATAALSGDNRKESSSNTPPIVVKGNAFFNSATNQRFYIRGVDYQPGGSSLLSDPLASTEVCGRDIEYFKELGINTVRVYTVDNTANHDECMSKLADAGIYLIVDVNTPTASLSRSDPKCSYNAHYLQSIFATIDAFEKYDNVLGFFAGNEVINDEKTTNTAPYIKAVVRDMKKYMKARNYRRIPVGYSAADVAQNRLEVAQYFNCGDDEDARIDMCGINDYSWCGQSSFEVSGYSAKMKLYENYSIPIFLSELGCNMVPTSRPFTEMEAIYSSKMSSVFSGALVYEYSEEPNHYGLVKIDGDKVTKLDDFQNLKNKYAEVKNPEGDGGYSESNKHSTCPEVKSGVWEASNVLPDMPSAASALFKNGAGTPLGTGVATQQMCGDNSPVGGGSGGSGSGGSSSSPPAHSTSSSSTSSSPSSSIQSSHSTKSTHSSSSKGGADQVFRAPAFATVMMFIANILL
ncbi:HDL021Wp [Eremothecium sinecaudum]|uniref:1,3-beta-glucanosyltransferase n=1 Tax=Eremothecium sinecaudum TaxID=45286 RepID=A0A0X8HSR6_9SACH|nr:HDL021Wp [Eremothecium sinecaudum]AMD20723.1 HDL021Wp [Eremothecium sinecaudum]